MNTSLVIGAAGGIGMAVADALVATGDTVIGTVLNDVQADRLRNAVPGISRVELLALDDAEMTLQAVTALVSSIEGLNQVVVCAAVGPAGPVPQGA